MHSPSFDPFLVLSPYLFHRLIKHDNWTRTIHKKTCTEYLILLIGRGSSCILIQVFLWNVSRSSFNLAAFLELLYSIRAIAPTSKKLDYGFLCIYVKFKDVKICRMHITFTVKISWASHAQWNLVGERNFYLASNILIAFTEIWTRINIDSLLIILKEKLYCTIGTKIHVYVRITVFERFFRLK